MNLVRPFALLALATPAFAQATILVPQDESTIQAAIEAASNGDVVLVDSGTYVEQIDFLGKAVRVRSVAGPEVTTIDSQGAETWTDFPRGAVVRMINGEGADSVLRGFTITGGQTGPLGLTGHSGVYCANLSPTLRNCIITNNSGGTGGGVLGNPLIDGCIISDNDSLPYGDGGGVYGQPTIVDSVISGNRSGGLGGGFYATGPATIINSVIDSNIAGNGVDGYSGGGVFGPATIVETLITRNTAHHYFSGGPPDIIGTGVDGAILLQNCTVVGNVIAGGAVAGEGSGGVRNVQLIESSILWNNEANNVAVGSSPFITYSTVGGGYFGPGNIDLDPLFKDELSGDYFLTLNSPAIDAGDPFVTLDDDGTVTDMGALTFPQFPAAIFDRNGSGINPTCFTTSSTPVIGSLWNGVVNSDAHGFVGDFVALFGFSAPLSPVSLGFGELLVDPLSPQIFTASEMAVAGSASFVIPVPTSYALGGLTIYTQAVVVEAAGGTGLCNALDLTLGL